MSGRRGSVTILLHFLNVLQQPSRFLGLMLDNRLALVANDCYTRVSIGSKLPDASTWSRAEVGSISECEEHCSRNGNACNAFSFGVDANGNSTCAITAQLPAFDNLETHPDYDIYLKKPHGSPWCTSDRLYGNFKLGTFVKTIKKNRTRPAVGFGNDFLKFLPASTLSFSRGRGANGKLGFVGAYNSSNDYERFLPNDDEARISDIIGNKNQRPAIEKNSFQQPTYFAFFGGNEAGKWTPVEHSMERFRYTATAPSTGESYENEIFVVKLARVEQPFP